MIELATYEAGMLQAAAYRNLMTFLTEALGDAGITVSEWALLGILATRGSSRPSEIAGIMDVKTPMATRLIRSLTQKGLVAEEPVREDHRAKIIQLTNSGKKTLAHNEGHIRGQMRIYMSGVTNEELSIYLKVLEYLAKPKN